VLEVFIAVMQIKIFLKLHTTSLSADDTYYICTWQCILYVMISQEWLVFKKFGPSFSKARSNFE